MKRNYSNELLAKNYKSTLIPTIIERVDYYSEFMKATNPGIGEVKYTESLDYKKNKNEIATAKWIVDKFGGNINVLGERKPIKRVYTSDYDWNNIFWEHKGVSSKNSVESGIRKGMKQIAEKPGGIVFDILSDNLVIDDDLLRKLDSRATKKN